MVQSLVDTKLLRLLSASGFTLLLAALCGFVYNGVSTRLKFRRMLKNDFPVPQPYSLLLGHLPFMKQLRRGLPKDAHASYGQRRLALEWQKYFPDADSLPPIVYLDLWPFLAEPLILAISAEACYQLTQQRSQPRDSTFRWAMDPVTRGQDMISMDPANHRLWRSRLSPGFSSGNIMLQVPIVLEEVEVFVAGLKAEVGKDNTWGSPFTLYDRAVNLTFDIIMRTALDLVVNEQTKGPSDILSSMRVLLSHVRAPNLWSRILRFSPGYKREVAYHSSIISGKLVPRINSQLTGSKGNAHHKSVISLALRQWKEAEVGTSEAEMTPELLSIIEAQLRVFVVAGHDTTAQAICWIFYMINSRPDVLAKIRTEHEEVFGVGSSLAAKDIARNPHKLNQLPYTTAVIKETLRLHPIGSSFRRGSADFSFLHNGISYPTEGALVHTNPTVVHLRADSWPRPTEFLPERFLAPKGDPLRAAPNAWRAFELGHTRCIGEELAMVEMKLALVLTVRDVEFEFVSQQEKIDGDTAPVTEDLSLQHVYRVGEGMGRLKNNLPTRVRLK